MVETSDYLFYVCALFSVAALLLFIFQKTKTHLILSLGLHTAGFCGLLLILGADWIAFVQAFMAVFLATFILRDAGLFRAGHADGERPSAAGPAKIVSCILGALFLYFLSQVIIRPAWNITLSQEISSSTLVSIGNVLCTPPMKDFLLMSFFILALILILIYRKGQGHER